jgi:superfamily II DNA or RNA helicase
MIKVSSTIAVENPPAELLEYCKQNLILKNPEFTRKTRMHLWTGNTSPKLHLYTQRGGTLVLPYGTLRHVINICTKAGLLQSDIRMVFPTAEPIDYGKSLPLYDYQEEAVERMYWGQYGILQSPAGSGKTQMAIELIIRHGRRALFPCHTRDLLLQAKQRTEQYIDKSLLGTITEGKVNIGEGITFATVQTMCKLDLSQYKNTWDVIIVDECHRVAGTPTSVSQFSKVLNSLAARHKYGLSATVHRSDGLIQSTYALLGDVVYTVPTEAVADKIMKVGINPVPTGVSISRECLNTDGTLNYTKLINYLCESESRNELIVDCIVEERHKPSLILSDRLVHLDTLMKMLPSDMREQAVMVSGKMTTKTGKAEREQAIEDMRTGAKKYLFATYSLCKEGLDIPRLERLYMATPQKDYTTIIKSVGRIARTHPGKAQPIVYDFVDSMQYTARLYKTRCKHYKKGGCFFCEEPTE